MMLVQGFVVDSYLFLQFLCNPGARGNPILSQTGDHLRDGTYDCVILIGHFCDPIINLFSLAVVLILKIRGVLWYGNILAFFELTFLALRTLLKYPETKHGYN